MTHPTWVIYDGKRRRVLRLDSLDGDPAYELIMPKSRQDRSLECTVWARVTDAPAWVKPLPGERVRRARDAEFVLEIHDRYVRLRRKGARSGYDTTIANLYYMAAKSQAARNAKPKRRR